MRIYPQSSLYHTIWLNNDFRFTFCIRESLEITSHSDISLNRIRGFFKNPLGSSIIHQCSFYKNIFISNLSLLLPNNNNSELAMTDYIILSIDTLRLSYCRSDSSSSQVCFGVLKNTKTPNSSLLKHSYILILWLILVWNVIFNSNYRYNDTTGTTFHNKKGSLIPEISVWFSSFGVFWILRPFPFGWEGLWSHSSQSVLFPVDINIKLTW